MEYTKEEIVAFATKEMIIYKITNLINNKIYIGQTIRTFNDRYHAKGIGIERVKNYSECEGNSFNKHLYNSIIKYGEDNFKIEILCQCSTENELNEKEIYYINLHNSSDYRYGYNIELGGNNKRKSIEWRLDRIVKDEKDKQFFKELFKNKKIDKNTIIDLITSPVVYIRKNGASKKYYYYSDLRICCNENGLSLEDGFCMAMRKRVQTRKEKEMYHHVPITKHEIWFRQDLDIDKTEFEGYKNKNKSNSGRPRTKEKQPKKRKTTMHYKECPCCGKLINSRFRMCADCKRAKEEANK